MLKNINFAKNIEPSTEETTEENNNTNVIIDNVKYENLTPGKEYTINGVLYKTSGESLAESSTTFIPETSDGETQLTYTVNVDNHGDVPRNQNNGIITLISIFIGYIVVGLLLYRCINNFINKSNANKQEFDDNIYDDAEDNYNDEYEEDYKYDDYIVDITTRDYTLLNGKKQN